MPIVKLSETASMMPPPKQQTQMRPRKTDPLHVLDRGFGRTPLAPKVELPTPSPLHLAAGKQYDRLATTYHDLQALLDGTAAAEAVAAVRAKQEERRALKEEEAAAAAEAEAAAQAATKPPKKGKVTKEQQEAEDAAAAQREAEAAAARAVEEAAEAEQAAADAASLEAANVNWLAKLEERVVPLEWTPLMFAAARGGGANVRALLKAGANVHVRDIHGTTPLHKAAAAGNVESIAALIQGGGDIQAVDRQGMSALHMAASYERLDAIRCLMSLGASQFAKNGPLLDGETAYQMAVKEGLHKSAEVLHVSEAKRKKWAAGHSILVPSITPQWEPPPFSAKRMSAKGEWDSIAFDRFVPKQ